MPAIIWAEIPSTISTDAKGERKATRRFLVQTGLGDDGSTAIAAVPVVRWQAYPTDSDLVCQGASAAPYGDTDLGYWVVTVDYDSAVDEQKNQNNPTNPADNDQNKPADTRPWTLTYDGIQIEEVLGPQDRTQPTPIDVVASNGQPLTGLTCVNDHLTFTLTGYKTLNAIDPVLHHQKYHNRVNSAPWTFLNTQFAAKTLRVTKDAWQTEYENGQFFWKFTISIEVKWDKWNPTRVVDMGTYERISAGQPLRPILIDGVPTKEPVPLNGAGLRLPDGDPLHFLEFNAYYEVDFAGMI